MKALSVRQPWAWLLVVGHKNIENRTWSTSYRGPLLIHASKGMTIAEYVDVRRYLRSIGREDIDLPHPKELERGGIIGAVDLVACFESHGRLSPWHMEGCYGFAVSNARQLPFVPYTGRLGIFDVPDSALQVPA
ncbi:ASCH domain-containing protein [Burkholderia cenocepacia]|uniref:ASCH domain-containing protein n=1 Tax=Burkholderia cenocepacia TaxID=95486 RepID=UPI00222E8F58|nr:ASCH domain-containing protein [Burkholderia cenocepacia]MCW3678662.1 ASCH domain-containing protein [Burkholderia cenocepacia]